MEYSEFKTSHKIIIGDSRNMQELSDESLHLVVTSPPYWQLKDYGNGKQIGFNDTYEEYINNLNLTWNECIRVLHKGCRLCINIGDQFARSMYYGRYKVVPIRTEIIKFCESSGLDYMGSIIWRKVTNCNTSGGGVIMGSYPYPRNGIIKIDYEFILVFKKPGKGPDVPKDIKEQSRLTNEEWNEFFSGHWNFPGIRQNKHLAMFPLELPLRLIKMFTFPGETVLDPFLGSGTTSLAAKELGRNSIGYELNREFLPLIKSNLTPEQLSISGESIIEIVEQKDIEINYADKINSFPYVFKDSVSLSRKVDPRIKTFGSVVDGKEKEEIKYYSVKEIVSPVEIVLNDGKIIKLMGIIEKENKMEEAINYLKEVTKNNKVFLKFDELAGCEGNYLCCFVYLKNKNFLNARLIKEGFVDVDTKKEYRYKKKFLKYWREKNGKIVDIKQCDEPISAQL